MVKWLIPKIHGKINDDTQFAYWLGVASLAIVEIVVYLVVR